MKKIKKIQINEATGDSTGSRGSYIAPLQPGIRVFKKSQMGPFTEPVSKYDSPELEFDSYDGSMDETKKQIKKIEAKAEKVTNYIKKHPNSTFSDDDGNNINQTPGKKKGIVPIVTEWFEITQDTILEDIVPNGLKTPSNYDRVIDSFKSRIPQEYHHNLDIMFDKIKDFIQDRGFNLKVINGCQTGYRGVRTRDAIILCSPESIPNLASFVYVLFHELKHEQQMSEFDLADSYMGDIEDFEEFYKIYWGMEMDADRYAKDWVKKIGNVLELPDEYYQLDQMITNYPMMSSMVKQMMTQLHNQVQKLKKEGMSYTDISDLDVVKQHLHRLEDMF
jgi:hypothetical protein